MHCCLLLKIYVFQLQMPLYNVNAQYHVHMVLLDSSLFTLFILPSIHTMSPSVSYSLISSNAEALYQFYTCVLVFSFVEVISGFTMSVCIFMPFRPCSDTVCLAHFTGKHDVRISQSLSNIRTSREQSSNLYFSPYHQ